MTVWSEKKKNCYCTFQNVPNEITPFGTINNCFTNAVSKDQDDLQISHVLTLTYQRDAVIILSTSHIGFFIPLAQEEALKCKFFCLIFFSKHWYVNSKGRHKLKSKQLIWVHQAELNNSLTGSEFR